MFANELRDQIMAAVEKHKVNAQANQYDRTVCITAIMSGRLVVWRIISDVAPSRNYAVPLNAYYALKSSSVGANQTVIGPVLL
jgi:hypothetical protein